MKGLPSQRWIPAISNLSPDYEMQITKVGMKSLKSRPVKVSARYYHSLISWLL